MTIIACPTCADVLALARAENERLTKERDAWKVFAQAERASFCAHALGSGQEKADAYHARQAALVTLRALGIDPEAP